MKKDRLAFILVIIAGLICLSNFIYKVIKFGTTDFVILFAGIFILGLGISTYFKKNNWLRTLCASHSFNNWKKFRLRTKGLENLNTEYLKNWAKKNLGTYFGRHRFILVLHFRFNTVFKLLTKNSKQFFILYFAAISWFLPNVNCSFCI